MALFKNLLSQIYSEEPGVQEEAIVGVVKLATKHANKWEMPDFPQALAGVVMWLLKDECPSLQEYAAWALGNLSCSHTPENKQKLAQFPQVLPGLVRLLSGDHAQTGAQEEAVRALRNLACAQENNQAISLYPNAFPALLRLLFDDSRPGVQIQATMAVLNLIGNAMARREGIVRQSATNDSDELPDALECLVGMWFSDATSRLQAQATEAIIELVERTLVNPEFAAKGDDSTGNMQSIADFPDALLQLLRSFLNDHTGQAPTKQRRLRKKS